MRIAVLFGGTSGERKLLAAGVAPEPAPELVPERSMAVQIGLPVVVKPNKQGSTVGLSVVLEPVDLDAAVRQARESDDELMIEIRRRPGTHRRVLDGEAPPVGRASRPEK
jgi:D-alanine-D-alanine ligase